MEVIEFISFFLANSWKFFTQVNVPGFDFTFAALFVGIFLATLGLRFVLSMLGVSVSSGRFGTITRSAAKYDKKRGE